MTAARAARAPAKINLTLRVVGRRADGYHDLDSLVVFAEVGDTLAFAPAAALELVVDGPTAAASGAVGDNLVLKAARSLAERVEGLQLGRFRLTKRLPVAAGLGGGSSDAAAALRLLARANRFAPGDPRLIEAARATGADVPVCLDPRPRVMRGTGDVLSAPLALPRLPAVLVNPRVAVPTRDVFAALQPHLAARTGVPVATVFDREFARRAPALARAIALIAEGGNDLEVPAIAVAPAIADVLAALRGARSCRLARMSGSGATCFGLFATAPAAAAAARMLRGRHPDWWVRTTTLG